MRARSNSRRRVPLFVMMTLVSIASSATADEATSHRFSGSGQGVVARDRVLQSGDRFSLRGYLSDGSSTARVQSGGTFALTSSLTAAANVCYNDTIFRDDFDGDGG